VVVQAVDTGEVLMVAWMNAEALSRTLATGRAHYWSRSRRTLWPKGETSGHRQHVEAVYADCDRDALLLLVRQVGVACHTGSRSCFFARLDPGAGAIGNSAAWVAAGGILDSVERVVQSRRRRAPAGSYVGKLLRAGPGRIGQKLGEEAAEVIVAALTESPDRLVAEVADLWFHSLVLLVSRGLSVRQVQAELARRHRAAPRRPRARGRRSPPRGA
jgi:phosphoribosyl-ATP pyrophosphohydrolase/phosphoribosyl-AMP cyclohydrolase